MKVFDTWNKTEVEKTAKQFETAQTIYPDRFTKEKLKKESLPVTEKKKD
jgi:hypothetical protein